MADIYPKQYLMTAGPTPLPPAVSQVMAEPILYHRAPAFVEIYERVLERLPAGLPDRQRRPLLRLHRHRGDGVGRRQPDPSRRAGIRRLVRQVRRALGGALRGLRRRARAPRLRVGREGRSGPRRRGPGARWTASRRPSSRRSRRPRPASSTTSRALAEVARDHGAVLCVDAVSGLGAVELPQDEWGVDVVVAGSQKSLMCPPGLGFASVSQRALDARRGGTGRPLLLRLEQDRRRPAQVTAELAVHPGRDLCSGRSTSPSA